MDGTIPFLIRQGYVVLFLWVLFEQLGLPIPAAPLLLAAGALAGVGHLNFALIFCVAVAASLLSDLFWYQVGAHRGGRVLSLLCRISLDPDSCVRRTKEIFVRHGARSLLIAKFIPGLTTIAPPLAGIFHMRLLRFLLFDSIGAFSWVGVFTGLGYQFSHEIEHLAVSHLGIGSWIGVGAPAAFALYITWKYVQRHRFLRRLAVARISPDELKHRLDAGEDLLILDIRDALEFEIEPYTIAGAYRLPVGDLNGNHQKIPRNREIILCCN